MDYKYTGSRIRDFGQLPVTTMEWATTGLQDKWGHLWVTHKQSHTLLIFPDPQTSLYEIVAGQMDQPGHREGSASLSLLDSPEGLAFHYPEPTSDLEVIHVYLCDSGNHVIRRVIVPFEEGQLVWAGIRISTLAGQPNQSGLRDGPAYAARFRYPSGLALTADLTLVVLDQARMFRKIDGLTGSVTTLRDGACRASARKTILNFRIYRVDCQLNWLMKDTFESIPVHTDFLFCRGHSSKCGPRNNPQFPDKDLAMPPEVVDATYPK